MSSKVEKSITSAPLALLKFAQIHPGSKTDLVFFFTIWGMTLTFALAAILIYKSYDNDLNKTMEGLQTMVLMIHAFGKGFVVWTTKPKLSNLIKLGKNFRPLSSFRLTIREKSKEQWNLSRRLVTTYLILWGITAVLFDLQPLLTGEVQTAVYVPQGWKYYIIALQACLSPMTLCFLGGFDAIVLAVCLQVVIQFQDLKERLRNLDLNKLKELVNYHSFLLDYSNKINEMSSLGLLIQYVITIIASCLQLFITLQKEIPFANKVKCGVFFVAQTLQMFLYSLVGELITAASREIADSVYNCNWYEKDIKRFGKSVALIIARAQRAVVLSGCGLVTINFAAFTIVFKTMMSFYAFLNTVTN